MGRLLSQVRDRDLAFSSMPRAGLAINLDGHSFCGRKGPFNGNQQAWGQAVPPNLRQKPIVYGNQIVGQVEELR
jgi:hypothetical protein